MITTIEFSFAIRCRIFQHDIYHYVVAHRPHMLGGSKSDLVGPSTHNTTLQTLSKVSK